jgi:asparagine synthase (glutamine-hydrolysing)
MCGIAGVFGRWSPVDSEQTATRMIAALAHRGPDDHSVRVLAAGSDRHLALAHARLEVLDLTDAAAQPMRHNETDSWLVFNGEIYNYPELRTALESLGHRFRSTGDTEVLLHALVEWGAGAVPRLNGMYAFAYWDGRRRDLMLARDPLGIKPLLLAATAQGWAFSSELRPFLAAGITGADIARGAVRSLLTYGAVIEPETMLRAVVAIPPGRVVTATVDGRIDVSAPVHHLTDLTPAPASSGAHDHASVDRVIESALEAAVGRHLTSDVPLGILLSGGIDSTLLAALASRVSHGPLEFITVGFEEAEMSETAAASAIAAQLRGRHTVITLSGRELADLVPAAIAAMDQPTVDGINTFVVSTAAARAGVRVLVSGLGGDEVFGGYTTFRWVPRLTRFGRYLAPMAAVLARVDHERRGPWSKLALAGRISNCRDAYLLQRAIHWGPSHPAMPDLEGPPGNLQLPPECLDALSALADRDAFHQVAYLERTFYMRNQLLRDSDTFSSALAIEMRVPYLDLDVIRAAWPMGASDHMAGGVSKAIPRRLLERLLPAVSLPQQKMGFTFPWNQWLRGPLKPMVGDVLASSDAYAALGLDREGGRRLFDDFVHARGAVSWFQVWSLFVLLQWHDEHGARRAT